MNKTISVIAAICFLILFTQSYILAQDTTKSLAFKDNQPQQRGLYFYQPDLSYKIWQQFNLIREAKAGDPNAEHELGLRYLTGEGFPADTIQGAYWIKKAADKKLTAACYNYGILLLNGWGTAWNPFNAFEYFMSAANDGMPQAEYIIGLIYTDNLIVKRNWSKSYAWVKQAAMDGYEPAKETLKELKEKIPADILDTTKVPGTVEKETSIPDSKPGKSVVSSLGLVFIDFNSIKDTSTKIDDKILLKDILILPNDTLTNFVKNIINDSSKTSAYFDSTYIKLLNKTAEFGSPEALTLIGRMHEKGIYLPKDLLKASVYYIRAIRLDSPRASMLLWQIINNKLYFNNLKTLVDMKNPDAMFVWHGLVTLGFDNRITLMDAEKLLEQAAALNHLPSLVELGLNYYTGKIIKEDRSKAAAIWEKAKALGSIEAGIRLETAKIFSSKTLNDINTSIAYLAFAEEEGSILAQTALSYCYENGIGVKLDKAKASIGFRTAAQRGSRYAYDELKKMYNEIRPPDKKFTIN